jgi:RimJ/RimL family protein N-acetyltransferase
MIGELLAMHELRVDEFYKVKSLLANVNYTPVLVYSVLENIQAGRVFVDDKFAPNVSLITSKGGNYFLVGSESNHDFNKSLSEFLLNKQNHANFYDLYTSSPTWVQKLEHLLVGHIVKLSRTPFTFDKSKFAFFSDWRNKIPNGFVLKRMDETLFKKYRDEVDPSYDILWDSPNNFVSNGFGFCLLYKNEFASVCNSGYVGGGYAEIDIKTFEPFRRQGLATITCSAFIEHCLNNNLKPDWHCDGGNLPSIELASKLGFERQKNFHMLWWHENKDVIASYLEKYNYS